MLEIEFCVLKKIGAPPIEKHLMPLLFFVVVVLCRSLKCSMNNLKFVCSWLPSGITGAKLSVKV